MEKDITDAAAQGVLAGASPAPATQTPRRPYEAPELRAVGLGPVFADNEYVYSYDAADNTDSGLTGDSLFGS